MQPKQGTVCVDSEPKWWRHSQAREKRTLCNSYITALSFSSQRAMMIKPNRERKFFCLKVMQTQKRREKGHAEPELKREAGPGSCEQTVLQVCKAYSHSWIHRYNKKPKRKNLSRKLMCVHSSTVFSTFEFHSILIRLVCTEIPVFVLFCIVWAPKTRITCIIRSQLFFWFNIYVLWCFFVLECQTTNYSPK